MRLKLLLPYKLLIVQTDTQLIPMKRQKSDKKPQRLEKENPLGSQQIIIYILDQTIFQSERQDSEKNHSHVISFSKY